MSRLLFLAALALCAPRIAYAITANDDSIKIHQGICDASGVVDLGGGEFAVADDELNVLLIYGKGESGAPRYSVEISHFLNAVKHPKKGKAKPGKRKQQKRPKIREVDIEGGTRVGDAVFWVASHGRKKSGKKAAERMRLFATSIVRQDGNTTFTAKGQPYKHLVKDLNDDRRYSAFALSEAAEKSPKSPGGVNIEAITDRPDGALLIGFRSPLSKGHALIAPLLNPGGVILGEKALFGDPIVIDLGGRGVRGLASLGGEYVIAANDPEGDHHRPALFKWDGASRHPSAIPGLQFGDFNPEAVAILPDSQGGQVLLLSDDGSKQVGHDRCKDLQDLRLRRFRSVAFRHQAFSFFGPAA